MLPTNVLIIDDSKLIAKLISKALLINKIQNHYFEEKNIYIAHDGMQAFEILGKISDISLVISDVNMPILNGEELIEILIDTDKITKLDLFFVTTQNIANSMSNTSKEYSVGVITKPFNEITFSEQFNTLQEAYKKKLSEQEKIKTIHKRQEIHLGLWLHDYLKQKEIPIVENILSHLIELEFKHYNKIEDDEIFMMFNYILEYYFAELKMDVTIDASLMEDIKNAWYNPEEYSNLGLEENFKNIISNTKEMIKENPTEEDYLFVLIQPIGSILSKVKRSTNNSAKLDYDDFYPFFPDLLQIFSTIDPKCHMKRINVLINHIQEIKKTCEDINNFLQKSNIVSTFPILKENPEIISMIENKFKAFVKLINQEIIPAYMYQINASIWNQAKKSPKIVNFLQANLKEKMPNIHNVLYYFKKLTKQDMKLYIKYDKVKTSIISNDRETLLLFKYTLVQHLPHWEISVYSNGTMLHNNIEKHKCEKLIIDLNFKDAVFNNGLQFIKHIQKNTPYIKEIIANNNLYFLASPKQVEILNSKNGGINYNIILKPINKNNIYKKVFWEL